jgi:hypothetical protein
VNHSANRADTGSDALTLVEGTPGVRGSQQMVVRLRSRAVATPGKRRDRPGSPGDDGGHPQARRILLRSLAPEATLDV